MHRMQSAECSGVRVEHEERQSLLRWSQLIGVAGMQAKVGPQCESLVKFAAQDAENSVQNPLQDVVELTSCGMLFAV